MKHNFTIDAELSIHPMDGFDSFTQNSVGTKYFAAKLDGWTPAQGEHLFVAFERKDGGNKLDPIFMGVEEGVYYTVMPREVMFDNGEWQACIYKKLNFNPNTGKADAQETGENFDFLVKRTIRDDSGNAVTQYDIANLYSSAVSAVSDAKDAAENASSSAQVAENAAENARSSAEAAKDSANQSAQYAGAAAKSVQEALRFARDAEDSAQESEQSAQAAERSAEASAAEALHSAESERAAAESAEDAASQALASKQSAEQAEIAAKKAALEAREEVMEELSSFVEKASTSETEVMDARKKSEIAQAAAEEARDKARDFAKIAEAATSSGLRRVIVHSLPEEGSDNLIYLVPSDAATDDNSYDEFLWIADEETGKAKFEKIGTTRTDFTADNIVMQEDITLAGDYVSVGNISKGSETGTATFSAKGKTVAQVLQEIFSKRLQPQITSVPSVLGFALQAVSRVEAGTHFPSLSFGTAVLSAGSYTYGPDTGIEAESYEVVRICAPSSMNATVAAEARGTDDNGGNGFTIGDAGGENGVSSIKYQVTVSYSEGTIATDNLGEPSDPPIKIGAGTAMQTTISVTPYRNFFYGTTSATPPEGEGITSDFVRGLTKSNREYSPGTLTVTIPAGAKAVYIACVASAAGVSQVINETALNADVTATFTKQENVMVEGAEGYTAVAYNVWYYVPAVPYENETILKVTLG